MARVNITVPDDVVRRARDAGLNVSRVATEALVDELDRRSKIEALDAYLEDLERRHGPLPAAEQAAAVAWVDALLDPSATARPSGPTGGRRTRRSA